ncbi:unnamed protein product [Allacma fusca]|uniref:Uncharacterized protein n=1 Tax=Allacma fusca TaxID=39272 RepID=A0A8J2NZW3_9HEXA|nr:unnamed protein product [Allacma fusca]
MQLLLHHLDPHICAYKVQSGGEKIDGSDEFPMQGSRFNFDNALNAVRLSRECGSLTNKGRQGKRYRLF